MADVIQCNDILRNPRKTKTCNQLYDKPNQARAYSRYRPEPPQELLDIIIRYLSEKFPKPFDLAVDVGCGTGQSTIVLAPYFNSVIGCDISKSQLKEAAYYRKARNINYSISPAENLPVADLSTQLLTAGTCLHWLDAQVFFKEADRVLAPDGVLAIYSSNSNYPVSEDEEKNYQLKCLTDKLLSKDLAPYMSSKLQQVRDRFSNIEFPFDEVTRVQDISQTYWGRAADAIGYIQSTSSFQTFCAADSRRADKLVQEYQNSIMDILNVNTSPESTTLAYKKEYFLILCRKRAQRK
ncbi:putative methyltransferase DDB_G0268948 isoform X1 [Argiope bruennichi]|uniref:putative methyltransferase DDB_G0268948 isoform X1 n=1 Tax=Argiope bruennichi TaxID=94029 RepID=UPI0024952511|nr:putative methyltransferase DDB_G0268948 isoform X1 [Argiope bruennichi]XP_055926104.1 putative methyltransferase DDB_G0268948 isoform X1 [Argiope bruennichi]